MNIDVPRLDGARLTLPCFSPPLVSLRVPQAASPALFTGSLFFNRPVARQEASPQFCQAPPLLLRGTPCNLPADVGSFSFIGISFCNI